MPRQFKQGDTTEKKWRLTGVDSTGTAFSGSTGYITAEAKHGNHNRIIDHQKVTFEESTALPASTSFGVVTYTPSTDEVDTPGEYRVEFEVVFSNGETAKFPSEDFQALDINPATT